MGMPHRAILGRIRHHIRNALPIRADLRIPRQRERDNLLNRERCAIGHETLLTDRKIRRTQREQKERYCIPDTSGTAAYGRCVIPLFILVAVRSL